MGSPSICSEPAIPNADSPIRVDLPALRAIVARDRTHAAVAHGRARPQPRFFAAAFLAGFFAVAFLAGFAVTFAFGVSTLVLAAGFSAFMGFLLAFFAPFVGSGSFW